MGKDWYKRGDSAIEEEVTQVAWDSTPIGLAKGSVEPKDWEPMQPMDLSSDEDEEGFYCGEPVSFDEIGIQAGGFDLLNNNSGDSLPGSLDVQDFGKAAVFGWSTTAPPMEHDSVPSMQVTGFHTSESPNDTFRVPQLPSWLETSPTHAEYLSNPPPVNAPHLPPLRALTKNQSAAQLTDEEQAWNSYENKAADDS